MVTQLQSVVVKREAAKMLREGAGIIYRKWLYEVPKRVEAGELVIVEDHRGEVVGCALYDTHGPVALRVVWYGDCPFSNAEEAIRHLIQIAYSKRRRLGLVGPSRGYRLVHSDGDLMPGLVIDVYDDLAVIQSSSIVWDKHLNLVVETLVKELDIQNVYEKSTQRARRDIGLEPRERLLYGTRHWAMIEEGGVRFLVDPQRGQKTGFFLDQAFNRIEAEKLVEPGSVVLDLFSYTGGFGLHSIVAGARRVVFVDEDERALQILRENLKLNKFTDVKVELVNENVWSFVRRVKEKFDVVFVDPPAFIPSPEYYDKGRKAYRRLYASSMSLVKKGGLIFLSSCSTFLTRDDFLKIVGEAAADAGRGLNLLGGIRGATPDHPIRPHGEHLEYLKAVYALVM